MSASNSSLKKHLQNHLLTQNNFVPPCSIIDFLPLPPEDVLPVDPVFHPDGAMYLVPQLNVEPEVDVEVLVVVVVENAVRLPWLEPESLKQRS